MRFTIVGAGALGTILGAHLIDAGHAVRLIARGERAAWLARNGLRVYGLREFALPCTPSETLDPAQDDGVLVYAVKTYHMEQALAGAAGITPRAVLSLANGVLKNEQLAAQFGRERVVGCMANFSGELVADGTVLFTRNVCVHLGGPDPASGEIVDAFNRAGIVSALSADIAAVEWSKFVGWVALFALSVIARSTTGVCLSEARFAALGARIIRETAALAAARGVTLADVSPMPVASIATLPPEQAAARVAEVGRDMLAKAPNHRMSSLQDLEAGRRLEVHETLGYAVSEAARAGLEAPVLGLCYEICAALDALPR